MKLRDKMLGEEEKSPVRSPIRSPPSIPKVNNQNLTKGLLETILIVATKEEEEDWLLRFYVHVVFSDRDSLRVEEC